MAQYRKKPIVVEAEQWIPGDGIDQPPPRMPDRLGVIWHYNAFGQVASGIVETLEGYHEVTIRDWIVIGIKGEKYPVKNEIFKETYELV